VSAYLRAELDDEDLSAAAKIIELNTAVADLAGVAAWMSFDGLAHNDSRRLFRVAVGCSGEYDWHLRAVLLAIWPARRWCGDPDTGPDVRGDGAGAADRLTATERAMASTVRGRPRPHHGGFS